MIEYICDGSRRGKRIGAGIIRVYKGQEEYFSIYTDALPMDYCHEVYAMLKVIEIAKKKGDTSIRIGNDYSQLLGYLLQKEKKQNWGFGLKERAKPLEKEIDSCKKEGRKIEFYRIRKGKGKGRHLKSHMLSRLDDVLDENIK